MLANKFFGEDITLTIESGLLEISSSVRLGLEKAIDELTHNQLCDALPIMLASNQSDIVHEGAIAEKIKLWDDLGKGSATASALPSNIQATMTAFYDYFKNKHDLDIESLKSNSPFANNMISHSGEVLICCYEMQLFCKYIALLSQKPLEIQKVFLDSFPPKKREDIACLGGTGSRISDLVDQLQSSKEDKPFMETHKLLMSQLVDRLKYYIPNVLQVHIPPFLTHAFSLESPEALAKKDPCFSYPSFHMPAHILWEGIRDYASKSKNILKKNDDLLSRTQLLTKSLMDDLESCDLSAALYDYETTAGKEARNVILDKSGKIPLSDLIEINKDEEEEKEDEEEEKYVWSQDKVAIAAAKKSLTKHKPPENEKLPSIQQNLIDEISSGLSIFGNKVVGNISKLIKSDDRREIQVAIESLWILGSKMKGSSPLQFIRAINAIGESDNVKYLKETIRKKLPHNYQLKIDKIIEDYKEHSKKQVITSRVEQQNAANKAEKELKVLISIGATTEEIQHCIDRCDKNSLVRTFYDFDDSNSFASDIANRPDCLEIIQAMQAKNIKFPSELKKQLLATSVYRDHSEVSLHILNNFELNSKIFRDGEILTQALIRQNKKVVSAIIEKAGGKFLDFKSPQVIIDGETYRGMAPIHCAAITGDEDAIIALKGAEANMNLRTGGNTFYPNTWQPVNQAYPDHPISLVDPTISLASLLLLVNGYLFSQTPMHLAASHGRASAISALIKSGSEIDSPAYGKNNSISIRPLHCAIAGGYKTAAETLIEAGASLESKTILEPSLASIAVRYNQPNCLELLIEKGVKIEISELNKLCQIAYANNIAGYADDEILKVLIKNGAFMPPSTFSSLNPKLNSLVKVSKCFEAVATAIMKNATSEIINPTPESRKELTKLKHEIYKALIKTYDFKEADLMEDLKLGLNQRDFINNENIQKIGQLVKREIGITITDGSVSGPKPLYKRIFSYSNAPKENVGIEKAKTFVSESLESRDNIKKEIAAMELMPPSEILKKPTASSAKNQRHFRIVPW